MLSASSIRNAALATTTMAFEKFEMVGAFTRELLKTSKGSSLQSIYQQVWALPALLMATIVQYTHVDVNPEDTLPQQAQKVVYVMFEKFCDALDVHFCAEDTGIQRFQKIAVALSVTISGKVNDFFLRPIEEIIEDEEDDEELAATTTGPTEKKTEAVEDSKNDLPEENERDQEETLSDEE